MRWIALCALWLAVSLVACSSDSPTEQAGTVTSVASATAEPTETLAPSATPATATPPNDRTLAYVGSDGALWVLPTGGDPRRVYIPSDGYVYVPEWSPDGEKLAFTEIAFADPFSVNGSADVMSIVAVDLSGTELAKVSRALMPHWSPDGTELSFLGEPGVEGLSFGGVPSVLSLETMSIRQLSAAIITYDAPRWEPTGQSLAYVSVPDGIYLVDRDGASSRVLVGGNGYELFYLAPVWSDSGLLLAFERGRANGDSSDSYVVISPESGIISRVPDDNPGKCGRELWIRDYEAEWVPGTSLAMWPVVCPLDVTRPGIWVKDMIGDVESLFIETPDSPRGIGYVDVSPDGTLIAFSEAGFGLGIREGPFMSSAAADLINIYVVPLEGGAAEKVISNALFATWRPD